MKIFFVLLFALFSLSFSVKGQNQSKSKISSTTQFIDSLVTAHNIKTCIVVADGIRWEGAKLKFGITNNLLILDIKDRRNIKKDFYKLDKLLNFYVEKDYIVFTFQR